MCVSCIYVYVKYWDIYLGVDRELTQNTDTVVSCMNNCSDPRWTKKVLRSLPTFLSQELGEALREEEEISCYNEYSFWDSIVENIRYQIIYQKVTLMRKQVLESLDIELTHLLKDRF